MSAEKVSKVTRKEPSNDVKEIHFSMFDKTKTETSKKRTPKKK